ncbi:hypothetical protein TNCV_1983001 [Trichonephila clavipes]|nr:hypothetical protein TNCV_1983001 [Trichonephila clavipes]
MQDTQTSLAFTPRQWRYTPKKSCPVVRRKWATPSAFFRCLGIGSTVRDKKTSGWVGSFISGDPNMTWDPLDEAHFWLNGYVNKQNCCIWREANPQVCVETPLHPEKLTVWCALWAGGIHLQKR